MKQIVYLVSVLALVTTSCSGSSNPLVGEWIAHFPNHRPSAPEEVVDLEFKNNGTLVLNSTEAPGTPQTATWKIDSSVKPAEGFDGVLTLVEDPAYPAHCSYKISEKTLRFTPGCGTLDSMTLTRKQ